MPDFALLTKVLVVGAIVAAAVMFFVVRFAPSAWHGVGRTWAIGAGIYAACGVVDQWPRWPPLEDRARFLTLLLPLAIVVEALTPALRSRCAVWVLRVALTVAAAPILLYDSVYLIHHSGPNSAEWSSAQAAVVLCSLAVVLALVWWAMDRLQSRTSTHAVAGLVLLDAWAAATVVMLSGYVGGGVLGLALTGAMFGALLVSVLMESRPTGASSLGVSVISVFSVVAMGRFFGSLSTELAIGLLLAPLVAWVAELTGLQSKRPAWRIAVRWSSVIAVLVVVVLVAIWKFNAALGARRFVVSI